MTASSTPPLHVLRGILRHIKSTPSRPAGPPAEAILGKSASTSPQLEKEITRSSQDAGEMTLREHVMAQYRASMSAPPQRAAVLRGVAYDYWMLKKDLVERARLHELDAGAEEKMSPKELSRRAAARAGLQLPKLSDQS